MTTLISKYKIYGRTKGRKKKRYNLDQTFVNSIITKDINIEIKDNLTFCDLFAGTGAFSLAFDKYNNHLLLKILQQLFLFYLQRKLRLLKRKVCKFIDFPACAPGVEKST